jgi:hypothetical protein
MRGEGVDQLGILIENMDAAVVTAYENAGKCAGGGASGMADGSPLGESMVNKLDLMSKVKLLQGKAHPYRVFLIWKDWAREQGSRFDFLTCQLTEEAPFC